MNPSNASFPRVRLGARNLLACLAAIAAIALTVPGDGRAQSPSPATAPSAAAPAGGTAEAPPPYAERLRKLSEGLRCLVCQNQTLADSHAELAGDLRREVEDQIRQGKTDDEIKAYLVARYGDFVLYKPPVQSNTMLLWFGPFLMLLIGAVMWLMVQRRSRARRAETPVTPDDDRDRARKLLE